MGHYVAHCFGSEVHPALSQLDARRIAIDEFERLVAVHEISQSA